MKKKHLFTLITAAIAVPVGVVSTMKFAKKKKLEKDLARICEECHFKPEVTDEDFNLNIEENELLTNKKNKKVDKRGKHTQKKTKTVKK